MPDLDSIFFARPMPTGMLVAILVAIVLLSLYLYRRPWGLPLWLRAFLAVARVLVLALVVLTLLEPTAAVTETHSRVRSLPVLLDVSESMSMKDQRKRPNDLVDAAAALGMVSLEDDTEANQAVMQLDAGQRQAIASASRLDLAGAVLSKAARPVFESLAPLDLSYHAFGRTPRLISDNEVVTAEDLAGLKATEPGTSIAASLEAVAHSGGIPPAGIVLLTDGIDNATSQRSEAVLQDLGARGIPVYPVPFGLPDPDDVSIRNIVMQEVAFSGDRVPVRVYLQSKGYERRTAQLAVLLNGRRVSQRSIRFEGGLQFEDIDFRVDVYEKGAAQIAVTIEPFEDEVSTANNRVERSIRVVNEKINVLYIEGNFRWEYRYLHAILKRDPRIDATFIGSSMGPELARNSPEHIERFPSRREEAFQYDLVILGDVDAAFFTPEELGLLEELIRDRGGSLLVLCGPMHTPASYVDTPVETMLPVRFDPDEKWEDVSESVYPVLTPEGRNSMVMTLENDKAENDHTWSRVAPMDHLPPLLGPKQGATVLAALSDANSGSQRYPLVAWQRYGTGKCLSIATDRMWRLRFKTGDKYHWRVWSQCIQFLTLSRLMGEHKRIRLESDRSIYPMGDQGRLYAHVLDDTFEPVVQSGFEVVVSSLGEAGIRQTVTLQPDRTHPGLYEGYFSPPVPGRYRVEANDEDRKVSNTTEFQVTDVRQELIDTDMRLAHLQRIADLTGGAVLKVRELPRLSSLLTKEPVTSTVRSERPLWDNGLVALLLVGLLGTEWILRKGPPGISTEASTLVLDSRVRAVWRRTQHKHFIAGLLAMCRWAIPLFLVGMAIDRLAHLPTAGRALVLLVLLGVSLCQAWRQGWRHLRGFNATRTALEIERRHGGLESLLVTAVQLGKAGPASGTSAALQDLTLRQAEEAAGELEPGKIIPFGSLRTPGIVALVLAGGLLIFGALNGPFLAAGLTRIFKPWVTIAYPTRTQLDLGTGDLVVKEGERAQIVIGESGVVPKKAKLSLRTGEGRPREMKLEVNEGRCEYLIASASRDFSYRVKAGDARSDWHQVRVITAPRIEQVQVGLEFPTYLERATETVEALTVTVPEGTQVHWQLNLDRAIREAVLHRDGEEPMPLQVSKDGRQLVLDEAVEASRGYHFSWVEKEHGFDFTSPRYYLQVASDQAPRVELTAPASNLNALLGRQLDLAVRAGDDHGIGTATITYRVNLRPEKTIVLETPIKNEGGEQALDWDYRKVLPDLKVGDTVSFVVEVADKYPEPNGPHTARSDTRRITFLSREEYLAQIEKKKDRLLSRVRSTYRQERAAHELVRQLNPEEDSFRQTCQLEAIRQEMLREQLHSIVREVQALLDDLKANKVTDAVEGDALVSVRTGLETIAEKQVAKAASLLRDQTGGTPDPGPAIEVVNQAARELAAHVLQRGIDSAREVFARESHMLAQEQATLRLLALRTSDETLAVRQENLAVWTGELVDALRKGMRYDKRPVSVLGLTRRIKELNASGAEDKMRSAAALIRDGKGAEAASLHTEIIAPLLKAEFSMRGGAEYAAIMTFRAQLDALLAAQQQLRSSCEAMDAGAFAKRSAELTATQAGLQENLVQSLLPPVPASRARLFDKTLPEIPPVRDMRAAAEHAITEALARLEAGDQQAAVAQQVEAGKQLTALAEQLERSAVELSLRAQGLNSLVSTATERVTMIEDYETRQIALLEQTEETALDEKNAVHLTEPQHFLAEDISAFCKELRGKDKDVLPLLDRLEEGISGLLDAIAALMDNRAEDALEPQEIVADLLAEAHELAMAQSERLTLLQDLYAFQRAVGNADGWMVDMVAEQTDLVAETKSAKPEEALALIPVLNNLRQCSIDIAPVLDLVAGRVDAGTPLLFAGTDLEDAVLAIEDGDLLDAADAQEVAAESLAEVQVLVRAVKIQAGYVAEIVEFLHRSQADAAQLSFRQEQLRKQVEAETGELPAALVTGQAALMSETQSYDRLLLQATGISTNTPAGSQMANAQRLLETGDTAAAMEQMKLAESTLTEKAEELFLIITMLHGLPSIEVLSTSPPELEVLVEVLAFASDQRYLSRQTEVAEAGGLAALAAQQQKLEKACAKTLGEPAHPKLVTAHKQLAAATKALASSNPAKARSSQAAADDALRHFVIEQALILETGKGASAPSDEPVLSEGEVDDLYTSTASFVSDFVSGEAPKDQKTEWEVLGSRNRAALNQNFARELPLEYRGTLKNYYERVAQ